MKSSISSAHTGPVPNERLRSIIVRFQNYSMKQMVLQAAWSKKDICVKDRRIYFDEDFTTRVFQERAEYRQVRKQLQERKIKSRILVPARLKVYHPDGKFKVFDNPKDAAEDLRDDVRDPEEVKGKGNA